MFNVDWLHYELLRYILILYSKFFKYVNLIWLNMHTFAYISSTKIKTQNEIKFKNGGVFLFCLYFVFTPNVDLSVRASQLYTKSKQTRMKGWIIIMMHKGCGMWTVFDTKAQNLFQLHLPRKFTQLKVKKKHPVSKLERVTEGAFTLGSPNRAQACFPVHLTNESAPNRVQTCPAALS